MRFRIDQMRLLKEQPHKFTLQIISTVFATPQTSIHNALKRQQGLAEDVGSRTDELRESSGPKVRLTHSEERTVIDWIGTKQRTGDCALLYELCDYASRLLSEPSREDIPLGNLWWRNFRRRHLQELHISTVTAREPDRSALTCEDFVRYFRDVVDALSKCFSPKQRVNMDESGVTAWPFKGKKRKVVSLTSCQTGPRVQEARMSAMSLQ
jgi:hypothetical protein